ncbi:MAG: penicillin acylase family protein [Spirochaetaceae bacterium]|nr:penicillin acylase family protein [Spirochaetaceae bacterium]
MNGTHILWDCYGIPHIFAPDHRGLFYAYGYAQMEAHGELLTRLYAQGRGRAAEFYGAAWLDDDRWVRINGIPQRAARWAAQQSAEFAPLLRAFVAGLNASAAAQGDSLGRAARRVLPFTVADVLAHTMRVINFEWHASRQRVASRLSESSAAPSESNGWAIGPSKSASGNVMLLSNSHLHWGDRHTYFEVQLTAPGVTSYGAVWVGFPVLRQCFTEHLGWTQTTNPPNLATLYRLSLTGGGYELDGRTQPFDVERQVLKVLRADGTVDSEPLTIRRSAHGPVVAEEEGRAVALRVAGTARPRMLEQFWRMGLARNLEQFHAAMAMQQLPLFNTMYGDRDGHIMYLYNAALPLREPADERFWHGLVPGNDSTLIWSEAVVPYAELPKVIDPPGGWVQNCNDSPWTCTDPMVLDPADWTPQIAPDPVHTPRAMRSIRLLSQAGRISLEDLKAMKLSTRVELADHYVDDLAEAAERLGGDRARRAAAVLRTWDRATDNDSVGALLFHHFLAAAGDELDEIGGSRVPADPAQPLTTPRGFAEPERAVTALDTAAEELEREYGTLHARWGDAVRLRRGSLDLPGNGAPSQMGAIRTSGLGQFADGTAQIVSGDTFYAVVEFSDPLRGEALLGYGNWSRTGSKHVTDQLELASQKRMRPILRTRREIEAALEHRQDLEPD